MIERSEKFGGIAKALASAQAEMENVSKDAKNPHFNSRYATLAAVLDVVRPALTKHGIALMQAPGNDGDQVTVTTMLMHESGEFMASTVGVKPGKPDAQGIGSAVTYLRRYALAAICGLAQEDDDGNAASAGNAPVRSVPTQTRPAPVPAPAPAPTVSDEVKTRNQAAMFSVVREYGAGGDDAMWDNLTREDKLAAYRRAVMAATKADPAFKAPV